MLLWRWIPGLEKMKFLPGCFATRQGLQLHVVVIWLRLLGPQHLPLARRSGKPFHLEAYCLHGPSDTALSGIGDEGSSSLQSPEHPEEDIFGPKIGLHPCPKGVEIDKIEGILSLDLLEKLLFLEKPEMRSNFPGFLPGRVVQEPEIFRSAAFLQRTGVIKGLHLFRRNRIGLNAGIINSKVPFFSFQKGDEGVEPGAETYLHQVDDSLRLLGPYFLKAHFDEYVVGLLQGAVLGMIMLIPLRKKYSSGPIGGPYDLSFQSTSL